MTIKTEFGNITAKKDTLRMLAIFMDRAACYYDGEDCVELRKIARDSSSKILRAINEYCNNH
jgi:hypothetical protein